MYVNVVSNCVYVCERVDCCVCVPTTLSLCVCVCVCVCVCWKVHNLLMN